MNSSADIALDAYILNKKNCIKSYFNNSYLDFFFLPHPLPPVRASPIQNERYMSRKAVKLSPLTTSENVLLLVSFTEDMIHGCQLLLVMNHL